MPSTVVIIIVSVWSFGSRWPGYQSTISVYNLHTVLDCQRQSQFMATAITQNILNNVNVIEFFKYYTTLFLKC